MSVESSNKSKKVFIVVNDLITALNFRKDLIKLFLKVVMMFLLLHQKRAVLFQKLS